MMLMELILSESAQSGMAGLSALQWLTIVFGMVGSYVAAHLMIYVFYLVKKTLKNRKRKKEQEQ